LTGEAKFSCGACGKTFRWTPAIAGKKGKCACGAAMTAPLNAPGIGKQTAKVAATATAPPKKVTSPANGMKNPSPLPAARAAVAAPEARVPLQPAVATSRDQDDGAYDLAGDDISRLGSLLPSAEAIAAAEKQVPPMLVAQTAAPLDYLRPATIARESRAERIDPVTGELVDPFRNYIAPTILMAAGFAGIAIYVVQKMGTGPLAGLAISIAFAIMLAVTLVRTVVLIMAAVILVALITSIIANREGPVATGSAIRSAPVIAPGTPMTVQPGQTGPTVSDALISHRIKTNQFHIMEGYAWCRTGAADNADKKLISDTYGAGAVKVYMDGFTMYALLPTDPAKRSACLNVVHAFLQDHHVADSAKNLNYQYAVVDLLAEQLQRLHKPH
jgi:hypothetical protein